MHKNAIQKMNQQEENTNRLANIINSYQNQFDSLATRQEKIEEQLSTQNTSLTYLQDKIEDIFDYIHGKNKGGKSKTRSSRQPPSIISPAQNTRSPPSSPPTEGGMQL